jgi:hypothetical protein
MPGPEPTRKNRRLVGQVQDVDPEAIAKIAAALQGHKGNVQKTAKALNVGRSTLYKWATSIPELKAVMAEHARGRGNTNLITYKGVTKPLSEWAEDLGHNRSTLNMRILNGVPLDRALTKGPLWEAGKTPAKKKPASKKKRKA